VLFKLFAKHFRKQKRESVKAAAANSRQLVSEMLSKKLKYLFNKKYQRGGKNGPNHMGSS